VSLIFFAALARKRREAAPLEKLRPEEGGIELGTLCKVGPNASVLSSAILKDAATIPLSRYSEHTKKWPR